MSPLMLVHVVGGSAALLSGAAALTVRKGGRLHARAGTIFFVSMTVMTLTGALIDALKPERATAVIGILTCYLVATSWRTARRRDGRAGRFEVAGLAVAVGCAAALLSFGLIAMNMPRGRIDLLPYQPMFVFAALAAVAAALDLAFILRRQLTGAQRIGRHLWRMSAAMFIATTSFFQGQQDIFPAAVRGMWIWSLPGYTVLAAMLFWIVRVRFGKSWRKWPPGPDKKVSPAPSSAPHARVPV